MRFRFTVQPYQTAAVDAVADCFAGQPHRLDANANAPVRLADADLLANLHRVQDARGLPRSSALAPSAAGRINLDVEMETGTGKTYVYIKTIFELYRRYGWGKFIVVVPGVAIREGVLSSLQLTADHFAEAYGRRVRFFAYRSRELHRLETFSADPGINVMVINAQAFNATGTDSRRIHEELDDFQSRRPIDVLAACRPVLILDEPQRLEGRRTGAALAAFRPLAVLRYSATHRTAHDLVHRLDALDAYGQGLVKRISVRGITADPGVELRRLQIREALQAHLARERDLTARGIKTLSLFFIDEVRHYRDYSRADRRGLYLRMFEEEYRAAVPDAPADVSSVHSGYFSVDRRTGRLVDPLIRRSTGTTDDVDAYDLILRDKERLLSLDEPVRFVFSHSALREGWDNPNVFVLCMLKHTDSTVSRRQEVGRGLRLAVDAHGERVHDPEVNQLTVVAGESYADFVSALQREAGRFRVSDGAYVRHLPPIADGRRAARPTPPPTDAAFRPTARVDLDTAVLIARCVDALDAGLGAAPAGYGPLRYTVRTGVQQVDAFAVVSATTGTWTPEADYDLLGVLAEATTLTRRTIAAILGGVTPAVFALYARDPDRFLAEAARLISVEVLRVAGGEAGLDLVDGVGELRVVAPDLGGAG